MVEIRRIGKIAEGRQAVALGILRGRRTNEPAPGAGSDPSALRTTAVLDGNHWVINGETWVITGAEGAGFAIIMAVPGLATRIGANLTAAEGMGVSRSPGG